MKFKQQFDDLLIPVKYVDSKVHRTYQKIGSKFNIHEGKRRYIISLLLNLVHI